MTESMILALVSAIAIPAIAWMFRESHNDRMNRLERLAELSTKVKGNAGLKKIVNAEIVHERLRRGAKYKWLMFLVFLLGAIPVGAIIGLIGLAFFPSSLGTSVWWYVGATGAFSITLAARNYLRSGPKA